MKKFKILFIFLVLFISVSAVHADGNFTSLQTEINNAGDSIEITRDYIYDNSTDFGLKNGISPFYGYHTVRLTSEIPVKENDNFTVIMKKDFVPIQFLKIQECTMKKILFLFNIMVPGQIWH